MTLNATYPTASSRAIGAADLCGCAPFGMRMSQRDRGSDLGKALSNPEHVIGAPGKAAIRATMQQNITMKTSS